MNGKGSTPRPLSVSREQFEKNWAAAFGKKKTKKSKKSKKKKAKKTEKKDVD